MYRIRHDHWSADKSYEEMKHTGFNQTFSQYRKFVYAFAVQEQQNAMRANGTRTTGKKLDPVAPNDPKGVPPKSSPE